MEISKKRRFEDGNSEASLIMEQLKVQEKEILIQGQTKEIEYLHQKLSILLEKNKGQAEKLEEKESEILKLKEKNNQLKVYQSSPSDRQSSFSKASSSNHPDTNNQTSLLQSSVTRLDLENKGLKDRISVLETKCASSNEMITTLRSRIQERDKDLLRLQKQESKTHSNSTSHPDLLQSLKTQIPEYQTQIKTLKDQNSSLVAKVSYLSAMQENMERLKEEKRGLEFRIGSLEGVASVNARLQLQIDAVADEQREWKKYLDGNGIVSPADVVFALKEAREECVVLKGLLEEMRVFERKGLESQAFSLEKIKELENRVTALRRELEGEKRTLYRKELELGLIVKEKTLLKESLDSFDQEQNQMDPSHFDKIRVNRIKELESLLEESYAKISQISGDFEASSKEKMELVQTLEAKVEELEEKVGEGLYNPITTRILQLDTNPALTHTQAKLAQLEKLVAENQQLRQKVSSGSLVSGIPVETLRALEGDLEQMRIELQSRETSIVRLKQVFQSKISGFRRFVAEGLGFNVDMQEGGEYKVTVKGFSFIVGEGEIAVSSLPKHVPDRIDLKAMLSEWIEGKKSMPGFFTALYQRAQSEI